MTNRNKFMTQRRRRFPKARRPYPTPSAWPLATSVMQRWLCINRGGGGKIRQDDGGGEKERDKEDEGKGKRRRGDGGGRRGEIGGKRRGEGGGKDKRGKERLRGRKRK